MDFAVIGDGSALQKKCAGAYPLVLQPVAQAQRAGQQAEDAPLRPQRRQCAQRRHTALQKSNAVPVAHDHAEQRGVNPAA